MMDEFDDVVKEEKTPEEEKITEQGDIQIDPDGTEWVVIQVFARVNDGRRIETYSRVLRHSLAHQIFATDIPKLAETLKVKELK